MRSRAVRAICTAVLTPGAITQRIDRVVRPSLEARRLIAEAARIGRERMVGNARRNGPCAPHPGSKERPFRVISISVYCDELQQLDNLVAKRKRDGQSTASRSKLIRAAVKALIASKEAA